MKKNLFLILVCFLILVSGIGIASAETLTGTLGSSSVSQKNFTLTHNSIDSAPAFTTLSINDIENTVGLTTIVRFDNGFKPSFSGTKAGNTTNCTVTYGGQTIATGTFGYQRVWNSGGVEQDGSQYYYFGNTWNVTGLSGDLMVQVEMIQIDGMAGSPNSLSNTLPSSGAASICWGSNKDGTGAGYYLNNFQSNTFAEYTASKPSGIGTAGRINKTVSGTVYASRAYVFDGVTDAVLSSDAAVGTNDLIFNVVNEQIKIGIQDSSLNWFNTSVLFSAGTGTPTPTVTPTGVPTVAPGYVRTFVETIDGTSGNTIHGSNIFLYDVEGSVWSNSSSDSDGEHYIDTLPYHTVNAYATYTVFADHYSDASALALPTGYYGGLHYKLSMFPPALDPGTGNVNLYVTAYDADTYDLIRSASVQIRLPTGAVTGGNTGQSGTAVFVVPNSTVINVAATKAGYTGSNTVVNSGTGTTASASVTLKKITITPTPTTTIPAGGVTPVITLDPRTASEKDRDMMNKVRDNGPLLIDLAIIATILGLLGLMTKGFK